MKKPIRLNRDTDCGHLLVDARAWGRKTSPGWMEHHRTHGPAFEWDDGSKQWFAHGVNTRDDMAGDRRVRI